MSACGIDPSARTAFDARIRQLQRLGVPRHDDKRPAGRLDYGIVELAALATATRLMTAFMVPSLAARYVNERWETLAPVLLAGARVALPASYLARRPLGDETMIVMEANALADLGRQGQHDERYTGALGDLIAVDQAALENAVRTIGGTGLILDATGYMPGIVEGFAREMIATEQDLSHELDRLRFSADTRDHRLLVNPHRQKTEKSAIDEGPTASLNRTLVNVLFSTCEVTAARNTSGDG